MGGSPGTPEAITRFARRAAESGRAPLRSLVFGLCVAAGECACQALRRDPVRLQWALLEVLWCACRIGGPAVVSPLPAIPCGSLDAVVLRLFRVVSQVAETYRWYDSTGREPLEWDGLPEVIALAVLALEMTGVDVAVMLEEEEACATPD